MRRCPRATYTALLSALLMAAGCVDEQAASSATTEALQDAGPSATQQDSEATSDAGASARTPWATVTDPVSANYPAYGITLHFMAHIYKKPSQDARAIGYMRRGARFRASEEVSRSGCAQGWFEVFGGGYVCAGEAYRIDSQPPSFEPVPAPPAVWDPMPYPYAKVVAHNVPQYYRLPSLEEEREAADLIARASAQDAGADSADAGASAPDSPLVRLRMQPGFYVSIDREVRDADTQRTFARTVRGGYLRSERLVEAAEPQPIGVTLGGAHRLPLAIVYRSGAPKMALDPVRGELVKAGSAWPLHTAHALTGDSIDRGGRRYFATRDGYFLRDSAVRVIEQVARPRQLRKHERWIRVDLDRQTLTAYEGDRPVFATLVSSGLDDHPTPVGLYRLHAKHVSTTMADNVGDEGAYSIEDVPWTMYFLGSYALHGAFWHDRFGHQRSHGCVNLAPRDARWLFFWTLPELPSAWHGVLAGIGEGTAVLLDTGVAYGIERE